MPMETIHYESRTGKFSSNVDEFLYEGSLEGWCAEELGDVESALGWNGLILMGDEPIKVIQDDDEHIIRAAILHEDNQGFFDTEWFDTEKEAKEAWSELEGEEAELEAEYRGEEE